MCHCIHVSRHPCNGALRAWLMGLAIMAASCGAGAEILSGKVVAVADGDTVTVRDARMQTHKIRLAGIDAPERSQPYGQVSRRSLSDQVLGQEVRIDADKTDRYARRVGKIELQGRDVNLEQLRRGLAWHYKKYEQEQSPQDRAVYADAEQQARTARLGLWRDPHAQAPWEYRRQARPSEP